MGREREGFRRRNSGVAEVQERGSQESHATFTPTDSNLMQIEKRPAHLQVSKIRRMVFKLYSTMTPELLNFSNS